MAVQRRREHEDRERMDLTQSRRATDKRRRQSSAQGFGRDEGCGLVTGRTWDWVIVSKISRRAQNIGTSGESIVRLNGIKKEPNACLAEKVVKINNPGQSRNSTNQQQITTEGII